MGIYPAGFDDPLVTQRIFRNIMDAFSHPLNVYNINGDAENSSLGAWGENAAIKALCGVFLDGGASFYVHGDAMLAGEIKEMTYAKLSAIEEANFVILKDTERLDLLAKIYPGSLVSPHKGATAIVGVPRIGGGASIIAEGPGIDGKMHCRVYPGIAECLSKVTGMDIEYPKGFELIFVTRQGDICAVPRHVKVRAEVAS
jgi:alpha-D-ribose 1-methylphosphonate 5-triphosphate synthase subunit PhnH